jgi:hypothetical protein
VKNTVFDWRLTRQEEVLEIDVRSDQDLFLVVQTSHSGSGQTMSNCDDPLKYPSAETAKQYVEECVRMRLADGWSIVASPALV